jgi:2-keto-4-pentenoate hydratase
MSDADVMTAADAVASAFVAARRDARALADYPGNVPLTLEAAYRIQDAAIRLRGGVVSGWKVGRIQPPRDVEFGTTRLAGPIFADFIQLGAPAPEAPVFVGGFAAVEAEFLFRLGTVPAGRIDWSIRDALDCVTAVHIGIEIASSPFVGINRFGPTVTISDFGNNNGLIVGPAIPDWQNGSIDNVGVTMRIDDVVVGTGQAATFPGGCGGSVAFLLENLGRRGIVAPPGTWVSTGAVSGVHEIAPGCTASATFGDLGGVTCHIVAAAPDGHRGSA